MKQEITTQQNNKTMNAKNLMFVSIAISAIVLSVCASVFTYNEASKVKFTCDIGGNTATYYVDKDDEESMSLLYARVIHAIKNSDVVYKLKGNDDPYGGMLD